MLEFLKAAYHAKAFGNTYNDFQSLLDDIHDHFDVAIKDHDQAFNRIKNRQEPTIFLKRLQKSLIEKMYT